MSSHYDYLILGAGGSGRWLALEMHRAGLHNTCRIAIVERDAKTTNDRTWCFWLSENDDQFLEDIIQHKWTHNQHKGRTFAMAPYRYCYVPSSVFYQKTDALVPIIRTDVLEVKEHSSRVEVLTTSGLLTADKVFTSLQMENTFDFYQSFYGWKLRWDRPVFDASAVRLMDFKLPQNKETQFVYVLPFSDREALVEVTRFSKNHISLHEAEKLRDGYLQSHSDYEVLETESGSIPMSAALDEGRRYHSLERRLIPIGMRGGATKPTTGYTFLRMRDHARQIVEALVNNNPLPTTQRKWRFRFYDRLLLDVLKRHPERGKDNFTRLFDHVPHGLILRFLEENTTLWEEMTMFKALPKRLFIRALIRDIL
jgi:lycopene beta-cyclase